LTVDPYGRNWKRGVQLNNRTLEMLEITELRSLDRLGIIPLSLAQGSYHPGVSVSGGTHDGGGALDVRVVDRLTQSQVDSVVWALRKTGFAAWHRLPSQGDWPEHIHAIAIGDKEMSSAAAQQVIDYRNGLNGLANKGPDDGPKVDYTIYRQDIDLSYYGPEKWDAPDFERLFRRLYAYGITDAVSPTESDTMPFEDVIGNDRKRLYDTKVVVNGLDTKLDEVLVELGKLQPPPA